MPITAYQVPGVYMEEVSTGAKPIQPVGLSIATRPLVSTACG